MRSAGSLVVERPTPPFADHTCELVLQCNVREWSRTASVNSGVIGPLALGLLHLSQPTFAACIGTLAGTFGASTILGSRIVNVDPRPGSLSTVMSPPIIWQKRRLMTSPQDQCHRICSP
jgi:hypothetical protein